MKRRWLLIFFILVPIATAHAGIIVICFPLPEDTWDVSDYPYWHNIGDTVYGDRDLGTAEIIEGSINIYIDENSLGAGEHLDLTLILDTTRVHSFSIYDSDGTGLFQEELTLSFTPSEMTEVSYYETNAPSGSRGSIVMNETDGTIDFTNTEPDDAVEPISLGLLKTIFE